MEAALQEARGHIAGGTFFDGIQVMNRGFEVYEGILRQGIKGFPPELGKLSILRTPEEFVQKMATQLDATQSAMLAKLYATRAELLSGIGAHKRAVMELGLALQLQPNDADLQKQKEELDKGPAILAQGMDASGPNKVPVTIITGFLGSGKTTLLNHILSENHGKTIAVIENEFGEVGIDDSLLKTNSAVTEENVVEMNNGCICCTVRGDLIQGLKKLHKQTIGKGKSLDGVMIETTGLADPAPVAQTFFADEFCQSKMRLDGILTLVDAKHCLQHLTEKKDEGVVNEAVEQVAFADRILLNKVDLVSPDYVDEVEKEIRAINKGVQIRRCENSKVDMDFVLGIQAFSLDKVLQEVQTDFLVQEEGGGHGNGHGGGHGNSPSDGHGGGHGDAGGHGGDGHGDADGHGDVAGHGDSNGHGDAGGTTGGFGKAKHVHDYQVASIGISVEKEVARDKLDDFLGWVLRVKGSDLYRAKGVVAIKGSPMKFVFHAVHMQFGCTNKDPWKPEEKRCSKLVFIGKNLERKEIMAQFEACLAT
mmetsp:Transcript_36618/g.67114  ORF Transcript_36618/g.67114 Transcript_36618/m.67114 type:complete len:535 (-) Transcript_36618:164-1768(-)